MGLNISVHRIKSGDDWDRIHIGEWDSLRHSGDREFAKAEFEWDEFLGYPDDPRSDWYFRRPKDLDIAIKWVKENIQPEENQPRLINMLERMKTEKDLWFYFGY